MCNLVSLLVTCYCAKIECVLLRVLSLHRLVGLLVTCYCALVASLPCIWGLGGGERARARERERERESLLGNNVEGCTWAGLLPLARPQVQECLRAFLPSSPAPSSPFFPLSSPPFFFPSFPSLLPSPFLPSPPPPFPLPFSGLLTSPSFALALNKHSSSSSWYGGPHFLRRVSAVALGILLVHCVSFE